MHDPCILIYNFLIYIYNFEENIFTLDLETEKENHDSRQTEHIYNIPLAEGTKNNSFCSKTKGTLQIH